MSKPVVTPYGFGKETGLTYDQAVERTKIALKEQGFGVLFEIDVRKTMKEKLGVDFRQYVILGACNPPLAHKAFESEINIGLLLPCNVIVYEEGDGSVVAMMDPEPALGLVGREDLRPLAMEVKARLQLALENIGVG
ncbi:MAG: DUF302 domain-containing protein [Dehalococcoidia bacterium]|nr:DUF302 domain-containing protein [Dehalococcoidia bacterium]